MAADTLANLAQGLGLTEYLDLPPWSLSKGQRLRVALGALLAMRPQLLLLDEPTTGQNRLNIQRLLAFLDQRRGDLATIICSHDLDTVCHFADTLVLLRQGRILAQGPVRDLAADTDLLRQRRPQANPGPGVVPAPGTQTSLADLPGNHRLVAP